MPNDPLAIVQAISTIVLVMITGYYAWQSKRTVDEMRAGSKLTERTLEAMKETRELSLLPLITCEMKSDTTRRTDQIGQFYTLVVENVGNAPATAVDVKLEQVNPGTTLNKVINATLIVRPEAWKIGALGVNQAQSFSNDLPNTINPYGHEQPKVTITLTYQNIYARSFISVTTIELVPPGTGPDYEAKIARGVWVKRDETTSLNQQVR